MENIYTRIGLPAVINASGRMTKLGVSTISPGVGEALLEGAGNYVVVEDLLTQAGKRLAELTGAADACITSSASAAIALAVAALICGDNKQKVQHLHEMLPQISKREVILLKGHNVDFGAPVAEMIRLGGGKVVEAGFANASSLENIEQVVGENTVAIFFVKSHHCVQKEMVTAEEVIGLANRLKVPCIVDAAAEEDLSFYINAGADIVCYSGAKAIEGPTSGFALCRSQELAGRMRLQYKGIGRAMKVGKEGIVGILKAVEEYLHQEKRPVVSKDELQTFSDKINQISGCRAELARDEAGREIYRCRISFDEQAFGYNACQVVDLLEQGNPAIYTRDYQKRQGSVAIDPRPLNSKDELWMIYRRLEEIGRNK